MKQLLLLISVAARIALLFGFCLFMNPIEAQKPRVIISSDIGGTDPDDNQSVAHLLMYSNEFDLEGLISSPSFGDGHKGEILRMIDVYEKDLPRLSQHVKGLMTPEQLRPLVKQGRMSEAPDLQVGNQWWTDSYAPDDRWGKHAGANTQLKVREEIMQDWAQRWSWLK